MDVLEIEKCIEYIKKEYTISNIVLLTSPIEGREYIYAIR